jgi:hypothetical protein
MNRPEHCRQRRRHVASSRVAGTRRSIAGDFSQERSEPGTRRPPMLLRAVGSLSGRRMSLTPNVQGGLVVTSGAAEIAEPAQ